MQVINKKVIWGCFNFGTCLRGSLMFWVLRMKKDWGISIFTRHFLPQLPELIYLASYLFIASLHCPHVHTRAGALWLSWPLFPIPGLNFSFPRLLSLFQPVASCQGRAALGCWVLFAMWVLNLGQKREEGAVWLLTFSRRTGRRGKSE